MKTIDELVTGRPLVTIGEDATALRACEDMRDHRVGAVLIVDGRGAPVGIFTERDLMIRVIVEGKDPALVRIGELMTRDLFTVSPERTLSDAAQEMQARHIRHVPVVRGGKVVALLSLRDLLRELLHMKQVEVKALTAYIQGEPE
jgi:CBS domain-containing protein